ncbi:MAG: NAD-dependent epimerase/dehydratase family protein, partial [Oleibacter sp.]|nr:NAD-dependent epimerase/dehydratase family protein [Thalassolituus sp.]
MKGSVKAPVKALVTGGAGFLGRYLVEALLQKNYDVTVFCRGHYDVLDALGVTVIQGDLANEEQVRAACKGQDIVFHVAAKTGPFGDYKEFHRVNVIGTENIIAACLAHGVNKLIYTSSPSVLSFYEDLSGVDEGWPYPEFVVSAYQHTKMLAEKQVLAANGNNGLITTALRPHAIWGPRDSQLFPTIIERAQQGKLAMIGNGKNIISVSYVENTAHAHIQAAESDRVGGKVYFINEVEPVEMWGWINSLMRQLGVPEVKKRLPYGAAYCLGYLVEKSYQWFPLRGEPKLNRAVVAVCGRDHYFDISAAQRDFNLQSPISMDEATRRFLDYYRNR